MSGTVEYPDFIYREMIITGGDGSREKVTVDGWSTFHEYTADNIWSEETVRAAADIGMRIYRLAEHKEPEGRIVSLDIETTTYIPKAREGFVNIVGVSEILRGENGPVLRISQAFNMLRKKERAPLLLQLLRDRLHTPDILIVFNGDFDLTILKMLAKKLSDPPNLAPARLIDYMCEFTSLRKLEEELYRLTGFARPITRKGSYPEYYKLFKGKGKEGRNKKIEPIGLYNLMDTLTPLYYYFVSRTTSVTPFSEKKASAN